MENEGASVVYHLVQERLWREVLTAGATYFPPTYGADGFTHATSNPEKLMAVANHFYREIGGNWLCLAMTIDSLASTGVETRFEPTAPVGDIAADFDGSDDELFPHLYGGIHPDAVTEWYPVQRGPDGHFLGVEGITSLE